MGRSMLDMENWTKRFELYYPVHKTEEKRQLSPSEPCLAFPSLKIGKRITRLFLEVLWTIRFGSGQYGSARQNGQYGSGGQYGSAQLPCRKVYHSPVCMASFCHINRVICI